MYPVVHWNVIGFAAAAAVIFLFYFFGISACVPPARGSGFIFVIGVLIYHCLWKPEILILKLCLNRVRLILIHFFDKVMLRKGISQNQIIQAYFFR